MWGGTKSKGQQPTETNYSNSDHSCLTGPLDNGHLCCFFIWRGIPLDGKVWEATGEREERQIFSFFYLYELLSSAHAQNHYKFTTIHNTQLCFETMFSFSIRANPPPFWTVYFKIISPSLSGGLIKWFPCLNQGIEHPSKLQTNITSMLHIQSTWMDHFQQNLWSSQISDNQFGFMKHRSTLQQPLKFSHSIHNAFSRKNQVDVTYFDIKKAFDSVSHAKLLDKLYANFKISGSAWKFFHTYLTDRQ